MIDLFTRRLFIFIINYYMKASSHDGLMDPAENENGECFPISVYPSGKNFPHLYPRGRRNYPSLSSNGGIPRGELGISTHCHL
jgi:hypothetical protein